MFLPMAAHIVPRCHTGTAEEYTRLVLLPSIPISPHLGQLLDFQPNLMPSDFVTVPNPTEKGRMALPAARFQLGIQDRRVSGLNLPSQLAACRMNVDIIRVQNILAVPPVDDRPRRLVE